MIDAPKVYIFTSRYSADLQLDEVEAVLEAAHVVEGERPGVDGLNQTDDSGLFQIWEARPVT